MHMSLKFAFATLVLAGATAFAQEAIPDAKTIMDTLVRNEQNATDHRGRYMYLSVEKSERTNGHTWTERMAETPWGKVKFLIAEDGKPLTGDRLSAEKARLAQEAADPRRLQTPGGSSLRRRAACAPDGSTATEGVPLRRAHTRRRHHPRRLPSQPRVLAARH